MTNKTTDSAYTILTDKLLMTGMGIGEIVHLLAQFLEEEAPHYMEEMAGSEEEGEED